MYQIRRSTPMMTELRICDTRWMRAALGVLVVFSSLSLVICSHSARFSAPFNSSESEDGFRPIIPSQYDPDYISRSLFTETGQYRVFSPIESDLRISQHRLIRREEQDEQPAVVPNEHPQEKKVATAKVVKSQGEQAAVVSNERPQEEQIGTAKEVESQNEHLLENVFRSNYIETNESTSKGDTFLDNVLRSELKGLEDMLVSYLHELFTRKQVKKSGISVEINEDQSEVKTEPEPENDSDEGSLERNLKRFARSAVVNVALPRAVETGRLFFFSGLKKILWPIFIGIQVIKSILFALFLPSIIGSLGKIAGQGSASIAGFNRPSETVSDLNFKDNFEDDSKFVVMNGGYAYNQPEASTNHFSTQLYDTALSNNALSRFGTTDQRDNFMNSIGYNSYKNSNTNLDSSLTDNYQVFKKVPASSLLLSSYDPFYSPLLSRLDSVFQQLGLKTNDENCREKVICLMYADPRKYAPYSNLVSAQLSRELDELRKPTSENPEILRFFKYMKAAKDGQDGGMCEETYSMCTEFKDLEDPAMINTYHDINKLVEARKIT